MALSIYATRKNNKSPGVVGKLPDKRHKIFHAPVVLKRPRPCPEERKSDVVEGMNLLEGWLVSEEWREREKKERARGGGRRVVRAFIASSGRRWLSTAFFSSVYFSAYFHIFNAVTRNFRPSSAPRHFALRLRAAPNPLLLSTLCLWVATRFATMRDEGCAVARTPRRRETRGTRPAATPRYTQTYWRNSRNLREALRNSKMAHIRVAD